MVSRLGMLLPRLLRLWKSRNSFVLYVLSSQVYRDRFLFLSQIARASAAVSNTIDKTTEPIRNTAAYKSLSQTIEDALDDSGTAKHAGFEEKELRRRRRQLRLAKAGKESRMGKSARVKADPELVFH